MEYKPKTIYCPSCGRKALVYDGRATNNLSVKCKKCNKLVIFKPATMETELKPVPQRNCSSGMRFY